ncbi:MAG: hypothetical protein GX376_03430 [Firmicutes bacterium]|nr:hypothetical protein [Bacillota bacterium]
MSRAVVEFCMQVIAIFLVGVVIKLIDDYLDEMDESYKPNDHRNACLAKRLGRGIAPYGLLLFATAVSLDAGSASTLFFAAYVVGMVKDPDLVLPTYLSAWGESLIVITIGMLLWGYPEMLSSTVIMAAVQLIDDYKDQELDKRENRNNLVQQWGKIEVLLLIILTILISLMLDWGKSIIVLALTPLISYLFPKCPRERGVY